MAIVRAGNGAKAVAVPSSFPYTVIQMSKDEDDLKEYMYKLGGVATWVEITRFIENRNMNVPKTLVKAFMWDNENKTLPLQVIFKSWKLDYEDHAKYLDEIEKYLILT